MGTIIASIKIISITIAVLAPLTILLWRRWRAGSIAVPVTGVMYTAALLPLMYLLSMAFARDRFSALLTLDYGTDSVVIVALSVLSMLLIVLSGVNKSWAAKLNLRRILIYLVSLVVGLFIIQMIWQLVFTLPVWLSYINLVGSWVDISILLALLVVLLVSGGSMSGIHNKINPVKSVTVIFAMLLLTIFLNVTSIFILLGVLMAVRIITIIAKSENVLPLPALLLPGVVLAFSSVFIIDSLLFNGNAVRTIQSATDISFVEIRPNWQGTVTVARGSLEMSDINQKLFGPGIGSFADQWRVYKPQEVNITRFWDVNFNYAVGFIPTTIITGGIVVFSAWTIFFLTLLKLVFITRKSMFAYPVTFIWLVTFAYPVDYIILLIAFILTAALLLDAVNMGKVKSKEYVLRGGGTNEHLRYGLLPALIVLILIVLLTVLHRVALNSYLLRASTAMLADNSNKAEQLLIKAQKLSDLDVIEQGYTRIAFDRLLRILQDSQNNKSELDQQALQDALSNVLSHARGAVEKDPTDPANYILLGSISEQLMSMQIQGAKESAEAAYAQALALDPRNPTIPFALARLSAAEEDRTKFKQYLDMTLAIKPNFVPALYQYALLQLTENNLEAAEALFINVLRIDNNHANSLYYLSELYFEQGRIEDAILLMERVRLLNPDNEDVVTILKRFEDALSGVASTTEGVFQTDDESIDESTQNPNDTKESQDQ